MASFASAASMADTKTSDDGSASDNTHLANDSVPQSLKVATWNVASVNKNPFEYWIDDPEFSALMKTYEELITTPKENDVPIINLFRQEMFEELMEACRTRDDVTEANISFVRSRWTELQSKLIVSGFIKDKSIADRRLTSQPDLATNTIDIGRASFCRPTVMNMYDRDLKTIPEWWSQWKTFMFDTDIGTGETPYKLLVPYKKSKYPAISVEEEKHIIPLQCLYLAIYDAITVQLMNIASPEGKWTGIKQKSIQYFMNKVGSQIQIILSRDCDVFCLQEVSSSLLAAMQADDDLNIRFHIASPVKFNTKTNQNSLILLNKKRYNDITEITASVVDQVSSVVDGDLMLVEVSNNGIKQLFGSFHGDSDGKSTPLVMKKIAELFKGEGNVIIGMDANTTKTGGKFPVSTFMEQISGLGFSNWTTVPITTVVNPRTYAQPQASKATLHLNLGKDNGEPKDHIIYMGPFSVVDTEVINNTDGSYDDNRKMVTETWPSDHFMVVVDLGPLKGGGNRKSKRKRNRKTQRRRRKSNRKKNRR